MDKRNPYIIDISGLSLENFIVEESEEQKMEHERHLGDDSDWDRDIEQDIHDSMLEADYPFEFSKTKLWSESFFDTEENSNTLASLLLEITEIKQLVLEIRELLPRTIKPRT